MDPLLATLPYGANLPFGAMAPGNPGGAAPGGWMTNYLQAQGGASQPVNQMDAGAQATALPGAPAMAPAPPPVGILNGAQAPAPDAAAAPPGIPMPANGPSLGPIPQRPLFLQRPGNFNLRPDLAAPPGAPAAGGGQQNINAALQMAKGLMAPPAAPPPLPPIQMARPAGAGGGTGVDPRAMIAAIMNGGH